MIDPVPIMMTIDVMSIIQVDATIIAGILILLTITNSIRATKELWIPKAVTSIVIPFAVSALLAIWQLFNELSITPQGYFIPLSLIMMFVGFVYLIVVIMKLSAKEYWRGNTT